MIGQSEIETKANVTHLRTKDALRSQATGASGVVLLCRAILAVIFSAAICLNPSVSRGQDHAPGSARELWLYYPTNLLVDQNIDRLKEIWTRAAKSGYTHVLLADSKFGRLAEMEGTAYFTNVERTKKIAADLRLKLVPALFSIGYSNDLLGRDPNLAEGLPVIDSPFVVKDGVATLAADPVTLSKPAFVDPAVRIEGDTATVSPHDGNARLCYKIKLTPHRCYHVSVRIKTDDHTGQPEIKALAGERSLQWQNLDVKRTQDWTEHHVVFNSLDNASASLYFGVWGDAKGSLRWRDWRIEEVGLLNVLRRPGTPVVVKGDDGKLYREGLDYAPIADPRMGNQPYAGEYEVYHAPPTIKTKLPDGTRLKVSWYHPAIIYDGQVSACIAEPKLDELLADQARRMKAAWGASAAGWMMSHDEFRTLGWCNACAASHQSPGQLLSANIERCARLLAPDPTYVWNDMFDPTHNAVPGPYYLVNGPWTDSWRGLPSSVVIMNWNHAKRAESLRFFTARGHKQIVATYYDDPALTQTREWIDTAGADPSVVGFMYTTWNHDYAQMEAFATLVRK